MSTEVTTALHPSVAAIATALYEDDAQQLRLRDGDLVSAAGTLKALPSQQRAGAALHLAALIAKMQRVSELHTRVAVTQLSALLVVLLGVPSAAARAVGAAGGQWTQAMRAAIGSNVASTIAPRTGAPDPRQSVVALRASNAKAR